jgi:hypothetical protein
VQTQTVPPDVAERIARDSLAYTHARRPAYVLITPTMMAYSQAYGVPPPHGITALVQALARSPEWKVVADRAGTVIYELPPGASRG